MKKAQTVEVEKTVAERARDLLDSIEDARPFSISRVNNPDQHPMLATWRKKDGYPALAPHPESMSMLVGDERFFNFVKEGPELLEELLELVEQADLGGNSADSQ